MTEYVEISVQVSPEAVEAVSQLLREAGTQGTVIEDSELVGQLCAPGEGQPSDSLRQENLEAVTVRAYYPHDGTWQQRLALIQQELALVGERLGSFPFGDLLFRLVSEEDWANEWKQYFHVTHVGKSLVIKPCWEQYIAQEGEKVIALDPGMSFGTGTHHTTNLCMVRLEEIVRPGMKIFDVGTGSGILAITAALLGAGEIKAVDIDSVAVQAARENIEANGLTKQIEVRQGDLLHGTEGRADLIIANILANIVLLLVPDVAVKLAPGGRFLASGIITEQAAEVAAAARAVGLQLTLQREQGGWVVMEFQHLR